MRLVKDRPYLERFVFSLGHVRCTRLAVRCNFNQLLTYLMGKGQASKASPQKQLSKNIRSKLDWYLEPILYSSLSNKVVSPRIHVQVPVHVG